MSEKQHKQSDHPNPTSVFHDLLAERCKQLGVPHYTVDNPHPAHIAVMKEIFGSGPVSFTSVGSSFAPSPEHKIASDQELTGRMLEDDDG